MSAKVHHRISCLGTPPKIQVHAASSYQRLGIQLRENDARDLVECPFNRQPTLSSPSSSGAMLHTRKSHRCVFSLTIRTRSTEERLPRALTQHGAEDARSASSHEFPRQEEVFHLFHLSLRQNDACSSQPAQYCDSANGGDCTRGKYAFCQRWYVVVWQRTAFGPKHRGK